MSFHSKNLLSSNLIAEFAGLTARLPDYVNLTVNNLAELASVQDFFEKIADLLAQDWATVAVIAEEYKSLVEKIMLGEETSDEAIKIVIEGLDSITQLPQTAEPEAIIERMSKILSNEKLEMLEPEYGELTNTPMGILILNTQEDFVVYNEFVSESVDHLENLESETLDLEEGKDQREVIESIFRAFHSIKGAAGFLGLNAVNKLCHECENMLDMLRKGTLYMSSEVSELILKTKDALSSMLDIIKGHLNEGNNGQALPDYDILPLLYGFQEIKRKLEDEAQSNIDSESEILHGKLGGILVDNGVISKQDLQKALGQQNKPLGDIVVEMGVASHEQIERAIQKSGAEGVKSISSIKVEASKLETLLEMAGELIVAHSQVANYRELNNEQHLEFAKNVANLGKISTNLQEQIMSLRLVPIRGLFNKMHRLVRDTAKKTGKHALLKLFGEDTEVDKTIIDQIADPLVHLLRNAVDHGIENQEERVLSGKSEQGVIQLKAYHSGGSVVIEIGDDGKGISLDKIYRKAVDKGFINSDELLSDKDKLDLIFTPGFSTNEQATDISGRGVGMDVVRKNILALGGTVEVDSRVGVGTTFIIRLPLTMAIVDGMIITIAGQRYVLPTLNIEESIKPKADNLNGVTGSKGLTLQVRGKLIPLVELATVFGQESSKEVEEKLVVVVKNEQRKCGLVIDEVLQQQQVVIKNLGESLKGLVGVSGGCILGDGQVGLILDVPSLIKLANYA